MAKDVITEKVGQNTIGKKSDNNRWWEANDEQIPERLIPYIKRVWQNQTYRRIQSLRYAKLYQNQQLYGSTRYSAGRGDAERLSNPTIAYNVIKSAVDTATSKIAKQRPRAYFLTEKGNSSQQKRAKLLTQYMDGTFDECDIYAKAARALKDSMVVGLGALKFYADEETQKITCERIVPQEILVDDNEGMYGEPGQLHQYKYVFKDVLKEMYPQHAMKIDAAGSAFTETTADPEARDMVTVIESWKLPSTPSSKDGRHAIVIENCTLFSESYEKDYYPFVFFRWTDRLTGFWGMGIAEELYGTQLEINKLLRTIQLAQHYIAVPRVMVNAATKVNTAHINNQVGSVVKYAGPEPKFVTAQAMSSEIYNWVDRLIRYGFEQVGISQLSATSRKPAGLESGVALREYNDIETERFATVAQNYERFFLNAAAMILDMSADMYDKNTSVKFAGRDFIKQIKWGDATLDDNKYVMRIYPTNILPTTPAAKLQKAVELFQGGIIQRQDFTRLVDFPDLAEVMKTYTSSEDLIKNILDDIVDDGKYMPPEPSMDLARAAELSNARYLEEKRNGLDPDRLDMLLRFAKRSSELIQAQAPQPDAALDQAALPAAPEALPTSDLIPNVPVV